MRKDSAFLVSTVSQVSQALKTAPLKQLASLDVLSEEAEEISVRLHKGKRVTPAQIRGLCAQLWSVRMRGVREYGQHSEMMSVLEKQVELLEYVCNTLKERWFYREWTSSKASSILSGILIIPVFLVLSVVVSMGYPLLPGIIPAGCYLGCLVACSLWAKDPVGLFWTVYSLIPLYILWDR
ncbi:hypothetical protein ABI58_20905 [Salmonella enterica subsp. enterica serovar Salford]|nr:hypothetical protein ABI58_20905 [Salmonella enterica subsp. enterica serovar Salford]HBC0335466.1 hypothetical protein [Salmonella enterica subsp. enterica serovar Napoli]HBC0352958.1 hypothetical protein [Salmonella enterica subsp. enterica serovar Napoli]HBJ6783439.1 hypothetical protein [Salmonella enterica subsp. enterica serovar Salford]